MHLNRGRHGNVWLCRECGKQLAGPKLPPEEVQALVAFGQYLGERAKAQKEEKQMKLDMEMKVLAGAESKAFLVDLSKLVDRMERAAGIRKAGAVAEEEDETPVVEEEADEDFAPKEKKAAKKGADFEEEDETPAAEEEAEEEEDFTAPTAKRGRPKKLTVDDVNDACKARAAAGGKKGREEVHAILQKKFKTKSVSNLTPEQYAACIAAMEV